MRILLSICFSFSLLYSCAANHPRIIIKTTLGEIRAELYPDKAPLTVKNFLQYVDSGKYDGAEFYRVVRPDNQPHNKVKIEVIQGGLQFVRNIDSLPCIPHETTAVTGLHHIDGTLSMARDKPGSASTEFFICIGNQPELDFGGKRNPDGQGFAAFGRVTDGMEVVRRIQQLPADSDQLIGQHVRITSIKRL